MALNIIHWLYMGPLVVDDMGIVLDSTLFIIAFIFLVDRSNNSIFFIVVLFCGTERCVCFRKCVYTPWNVSVTVI